MQLTSHRLRGEMNTFCLDSQTSRQTATSAGPKREFLVRISDALTLDYSERSFTPVPQQQVSRPPGRSTSSATVETQILQKFSAFLNYSDGAGLATRIPDTLVSFVSRKTLS